jgi:putative SOS response-associated peptidase YedK
MCGRFAEISTPKMIADALGVAEGRVPPRKPRYNIAPTHPVFGVYAQGKTRVVDVFTWGLVPVWAKDPEIGARLINARSETVSEKPSFCGSFKNSRCLIIADGFYEWRKTSAGKQPYFIRLKSREPFGFGGLWSHWTGADGSEIRSCAILTTSPNAVMKPIHDRMPVIIPKQRIGEWLDHNSYDPRLLSDFFTPYSDDALEAYPVSPLVNSPANDSEDCMAEVPPLGFPDKLL